MKEKIKLLLKWSITFVLCFAVIYLFVFIGGWQFFESDDPILMEMGAAFVLSFFVFVFYEIVAMLAKRIKQLEDRLDEIESK